MKKYIIGLLLVGTLALGGVSQAKAATLDDIFNQFSSLQQSLSGLKDQLTGLVLSGSLKAGDAMKAQQMLQALPATDVAATAAMQTPVAANAKVSAQPIQMSENPVRPVIIDFTQTTAGASAIVGPSGPTTADTSVHCQQNPTAPECKPFALSAAAGASAVAAPSGPTTADTSVHCQQNPTAPECKPVALSAAYGTSVSVANTTPSFTGTLVYGQTSDQVKALQDWLIKKGYMAAGNDSGYYGKGTMAAVQVFQNANSIAGDGSSVGPKTQAAITGSSTGTTPTPSNTGVPVVITTGPVAHCITSGPFMSAPSVTVTSPNGGEVYTAGQQVTVRWTTCNIPASSQMAVNINWPISWNTQFGIANAVTTNTGSFTWTMPPASLFHAGGLQYGQYFKMSVAQGTVPLPAGSSLIDSSDNFFTINPAPLTLTYPNSGTFSQGSTVNITYSGGNTTWPIYLALINSAQTQVYQTIVPSAPYNSGTYVWTIPATVAPGTYHIYLQGDRGQADSQWQYGGPITITSGVIGACTLTEGINNSVTTQSQYIATGTTTGATDASKATFHISSTGGAATVSFLSFTVTGANTVTSLRIVPTVAVVNGASASFSNLSLAVPTGTGLDIPVFVSYSPVGPTGVLSGSNSSIALTSIGYTCGGVTAISSVNNVSAPSMRLVGSRPSLTLVDSSAPLVNGLVKIASLNVAADAQGSIAINAIPLTVSSLNNVTIVGSVNNLVVRDANGVTLNTNGSLSVPLSGTGLATINLIGGYTISAGSTATFNIYATASNVTGGPNSNRLTTILGNLNNFRWTDVAGSGLTGAETGGLIYNYPTNSSVIND